MSQDKKFGTFGGVFTPSILTILGVIMYMRLPWIVGQAGFVLTLGIILVAHIVSVCTGLSVSSIATDKKVKAGGTYYIISRSMGLSIGGTLGIALFFGMSLSISLYLIGFSESFLGFWGLPITKDTIRLTGTIAVIAVGSLVIISTSLAIKTQYFIMTTIALSLVTVLFGKGEFAPAKPLLNPVTTTVPLIMLFAIYFPAVTGFEAGVSMSGDLKDPKKSIPVGTISAIALGLLVYIGLAAFFAFRVSSDQLMNNPNILLEISFFPPLLVAGIWGATLSSAIGSILGAPRILQATSSDGITPRIFAKGYGKTNEPRNALILTFIIAEAGILIGELNLIARVVSMFFITTYGFLNLSCAVEKWASTDFLPSFKIPAWVSIIGAAVCFILMLELDFIALIGAVIIMSSIFLFLKKKELTLESGDTWEGIWSSILRYGLNHLDRTVKQQRNWRPNIILFSGGTTARPHLMEFGRWLVHKRGIISNFNLIENKNARHIIPKVQQELEEKESDFSGIFTRHMEVNDIYEGMETVTKVYGFAGIEPNSVMLGWARTSKQPEKFAQLIENFKKLDYNILLLDYHYERGFGSHKIIDIWWGGGSNSLSLGLTLIKFLKMSEDWEESHARIFIVTDGSSLNNIIYKTVNNAIEEYRIEASVKIINNNIDQSSVNEIIIKESQDSDLVILGLREVEKKNVAQYISETDSIIKTLGTVVLIQASSFFKPINTGLERAEKIKQTKIIPDSKIGYENLLSALILPKHELLADSMKVINKKLEEAFACYQQGSLKIIHAENLLLLKEIEKLIERNFNDIKEVFPDNGSLEVQLIRKTLAHANSNYLFNSNRIIQTFQKTTLSEQKDNLSADLQSLLLELQKMHTDSLSELIIFVKPEQTDDISNRTSIWEKIKLKSGNKAIRRKIRMQLFTHTLIKQIEQDVVYKHLQDFGLQNYRLTSDLQKLFTSVSDSFQAIGTDIEKDSIDETIFDQERIKIKERIFSVFDKCQKDYQRSSDELQKNLYQLIQSMSNDLESANINRLVKKKNKIINKTWPANTQITQIPDAWFNNQRLMVNLLIEDLILKNFQNRIKTILERFISGIQLSIENNYSDRLDKLSSNLESVNSNGKKNISWPAFYQEAVNTEALFHELLKDIKVAEEELPETIELMAEESFQNIEQDQFADVLILNINLLRYAGFLIETELIDPLQRHVSELSVSLQKTNDVVLDIVRFTNHNLSLSSDENMKEDKGSLSVIIKSGLNRISAEKTNISKLQQNLQIEFKRLMCATFEKMNPYLISKSAGELKQTIRTRESRKIFTQAVKISDWLKTKGKNLIVRLIYQKSESILFAKKLSRVSGAYQTETGYLLEMVKLLSPDSEINRMLPFYYKQLFIGNQIICKEFLIEREYEIGLAYKAVDMYRQGYKGALLVLGDRHSGKSTLSRCITNKYFDRNKTFQVFPPEGGSIDPDEFKNRLTGTLKQNGDYDNIFNNLPQNSVIIFHDMELWWERSSKGFAVIEDMIDLICNYSDKCFFIVNAGTHSFKFINRLKPIENTFISAIECQPFDSEELQQATLLRHRSTGLKFQFGKQNEDSISNFRLARLFNNYFDISNGNIGQAIHYWISNIVKVNPLLIDIRTPIIANNQALKKLNTDWLIILQQFMLHKHLTSKRMEQLLGIEKNETGLMIQSLMRSGLIQEIQPEIMQISPYIQPLITKYLDEMDLL
ncbi:MAG: amino acid permease [Proteobacteria bacterium]|nr:amino acid permease [Pseudomonadota bacterium]